MMRATEEYSVDIGENALLPLDILKIKKQTNLDAFHGRGVFRIVSDKEMAYTGKSYSFFTISSSPATVIDATDPPTILKKCCLAIIT